MDHNSRRLWPTRLKSTGVCRKSLFSKPALEASIKQPKENILLTIKCSNDISASQNSWSCSKATSERIPMS